MMSMWACKGAKQGRSPERPYSYNQTCLLQHGLDLCVAVHKQG